MDVNLIRLSPDIWLLLLNCVTEKPRHSIGSETKSQRNAILFREFGSQNLQKVYCEKLDVMEDPHVEDAVRRPV